MTPLTELLQAWQLGDKQAESQLINLVEGELRRLAHQALQQESHPKQFQTTEMLSELYLRLNDQNPNIQWQNRNQFFGFTSRILRQILVDAHRHRNATKRGSQFPHLVFESDLIMHNREPIDFLALHEALEVFEGLDPEKGKMVEMRFFGGMTHEQVAEALNISTATAKRGWRVAQAWLLNYLKTQKHEESRT